MINIISNLLMADMHYYKHLCWLRANIAMDFLSKMMVKEFDAILTEEEEVMKRQVGQSYGFVKLRLTDDPRTPEDRIRICGLWVMACLYSVTFYPDRRTHFAGYDISLKVYSWEPVIFHDALDMGWSTLDDLYIDDGKLFRCTILSITCFIPQDNSARDSAKSKRESIAIEQDSTSVSVKPSQRRESIESNTPTIANFQKRVLADDAAKDESKEKAPITAVAAKEFQKASSPGFSPAALSVLGYRASKASPQKHSNSGINRFTIFLIESSIHITGTSLIHVESHHRFFPVDTSLIHIESRKSPTKSLFDVGSRRISIFTVNTKEYHSESSGNYHKMNA
ncbi:hypothetical protein Tco_1476225 [Tanacetum coccineum]